MKQGHVVRVLGPIDIGTREGALAVGGHQPRALLGALTIAAGHVAPTDHLVEVLWGDYPPSTATNTLQSYVSHLRHLLGADAVIRVDHGYTLVAGVDQIDALRFEQLLGRATDRRTDPEECRNLCREALGLWRGRPFGDLADEEPFHLEACRLDELRLATMELLLESQLALGRHELVVGELENEVEEYPYRERLWYLLIEALARDDRRVEAMRACTRLREVLAETGLEGGKELCSLEERILSGELTSGAAGRWVRGQ